MGLLRPVLLEGVLPSLWTMVCLLCDYLNEPATELGLAGRFVTVIILCSAVLEGPACGLWLTGRFVTAVFLRSAGEAGYHA